MRGVRGCSGAAADCGVNGEAGDGLGAGWWKSGEGIPFFSHRVLSLSHPNTLTLFKGTSQGFCTLCRSLPAEACGRLHC